MLGRRLWLELGGGKVVRLHGRGVGGWLGLPPRCAATTGGGDEGGARLGGRSAAPRGSRAGLAGAGWGSISNLAHRLFGRWNFRGPWRGRGFPGGMSLGRLQSGGPIIDEIGGLGLCVLF